MQAKNGDGARRTVRDVLQYLITIPDVKEAIKEDGSKVKLRFAADGRRTSKRIGTVMAVLISCLKANRHMNTSTLWLSTMVSGDISSFITNSKNILID